MGDGFARWTIGGSVMAWSIGVPTLWKTGIEGYAPPHLIGGTFLPGSWCAGMSKRTREREGYGLSG